MNNDTFCRLPVNSAQCYIGTEKYPDAAISSKHDDDDYSRRYGQIKEAFIALTKDDVLKACISNRDFKSSNVRADDVSYYLYIFVILYQHNSTAFQPLKVELNIDGVVRIDIIGHALVLTTKIVSSSSECRQYFDLI